MRSLNDYSPARVLLSLLALCSAVSAHSWVEQLRVIGPNGTFTDAPGYIRGFVPRNQSGFTDADDMNKILDPIQGAPLCNQTSQQPGPANPAYPRLVASPGSSVALLYLENGHITKPNTPPGKPKNSGTVWIYGTSDPQANQLLSSVHKVWNTAGTGGDKRGKLLSTQNFDDGQCYENNQQPTSLQRQQKTPVGTGDSTEGNNLWCQNNIILPAEAQAGKPYTVYWVWDWPTDAQAAPPKGLNELYTSCIDIDVKANAAGSADKVAMKYVQGQPPQNAAVPSYVSQLASGKNIMVTSQPRDTPVAAGTSSAPNPPASTQANPKTQPSESASTLVAPATTAVNGSNAAPAVVPIPASGPAVPSQPISVSSAIPIQSSPAVSPTPAIVSPAVSQMSVSVSSAVPETSMMVPSAVPTPDSQAPSSGETVYVYPVTTLWATGTSLPANFAPVTVGKEATSVSSVAAASLVTSALPTNAPLAVAAPPAKSVPSAVPSPSTLSTPSAMSAPPAASKSSAKAAPPSASAAPSGADNNIECTSTGKQKRSKVFANPQPEKRSLEAEASTVDGGKLLRHSARFRNRHA